MANQTELASIIGAEIIEGFAKGQDQVEIDISQEQMDMLVFTEALANYLAEQATDLSFDDLQFFHEVGGQKFYNGASRPAIVRKKV